MVLEWFNRLKSKGLPIGRLTESCWDVVSSGCFEDFHLLSSSFDDAVGQVLVHFIVRIF